MRILLIEDEPELQVITAAAILSILRSAEIELADNAAAAIGAIEREPPALIVSDFDLADGSTGGEVLAWIVERHPALVARFVFVSGNPVCEEIHHRSVMKPYSKRALRAELLRAA